MAVVTKRRDRHNIVAEILKAARGGDLMTHVMFKANLSYSQLCKYLILLLEKGFLENTTIEQETKTQIMYRTTKKGIRFLVLSESLDKIWGQQ